MKKKREDSDIKSLKRLAIGLVLLWIGVTVVYIKTSLKEEERIIKFKTIGVNYE